jgi:hypothetical protein
MTTKGTEIGQTSMSITREIRFNSYNTRRNLPDDIRRKRGEANFVGTFIRTMLQEFQPPCAYGRNFPVPGCGVADLVLCELPRGIEQGVGLAGLYLSAFEMKLADWRRALQQAYRYKYYADSSIVVLPASTADRAVESSALFEALGVGLWTLDMSTRIIHKHVAAVQSDGPFNTGKRDQVLSRLRPRLAYFRKSHEET